MRTIPEIPIPLYDKSRSIKFFNSSGDLYSTTNDPGFRPSFTSNNKDK